MTQAEPTIQVYNNTIPKENIYIVLFKLYKSINYRSYNIEN